MVLIDVPALPTSTFEASRLLTPLAEVTVSGRALPSADGVSLAGATLRVYYAADWLCGFFGTPECAVPNWEIALDRLGDGASFSLHVPDFAHDPIIAKSIPMGRVKFRADRSEAPFHYWLEPDGATPGGIPVAAVYRDLRLRPRRH